AYLGDGRVEESINFDPATGDSSQKITYLYGDYDRLSEVTTLMYNSGTWQYLFKMLYGYDNNGNPTETNSMLWLGGEWIQMSGSRNTYFYNQDDWVIEKTVENYFASAWEFNRKEIYTLDMNGFPTSILSQLWDDGWIDDFIYSDIEWHDYSPYTGAGDYLYFLRKRWTGSLWSPELRETTSYDGTGGYTSIQETYYIGAWQNYKRISLSMYSFYPAEEIIELWEDELWKQIEGTKNLLTFEGIDLTEMISQNWSLESNEYQNISKKTFSDFLHIFSLEENSSINSLITVAPNPASEFLNIEFIEKIDGPVTVYLMNFSGQDVFVIKNINIANPGMIAINVNQYPKGLYIINIKSTKGSFSRKVILQ
ncbi:MAG: T9SS type A sorting domain-containing protein, partial [Bacteroidales bacterium]|nr:T9SS type A sorting domain-containing protein [Bacteroidales bacterium]